MVPTAHPSFELQPKSVPTRKLDGKSEVSEQRFDWTGSPQSINSGAMNTLTGLVLMGSCGAEHTLLTLLKINMQILKFWF